MTPTPFRSVVLAGERPEGNALARELGLPAGVLAPLAGEPCLARVLHTLEQAAAVAGGVICGPRPEVLEASPELRRALDASGFIWLAPERGPAASAVAGADHLGVWPVLLTSGDHGLLDPATVDAFCSDAAHAAAAGDLDLVVGLVPHALVQDAFPHSRRTVLSFADGSFCGSNLFALMTPESRRGLTFWSSVEAFRKHPLKIARQLGTGLLLRYAARRLTVDAAFDALSRRCGCRVGWVPVNAPRAAVDVDSRADWELADRLLGEDARRAPA